MRQYLCNRCAVWGGGLVAGWEETLSPEIVRSGVGGGRVTVLNRDGKKELKIWR